MKLYENKGLIDLLIAKSKSAIHASIIARGFWCDMHDNMIANTQFIVVFCRSLWTVFTLSRHRNG